MKKKKSIPLWVFFILIFDLLFSGVSLCFSIAALGKPFPKLIGSPENFIAIIGIIMALIAASATVYSIGMSHDITKYRTEIDEYRSMFVGIGEEMQSQYKETLNVLSAIEGIASEKAIYIRLFQGRLMCRSRYSDDQEKNDGISYILGYYTSGSSGRSSIDEDVKILKQLTYNYKIDKDVRDNAQRAIEIIEGKKLGQDKEEQKSKTILSKMEHLLDKIEELLPKKREKNKGNEKAKK